MADNYNFGCETSEGGNIGIGNCNRDLKNVKALIFVSKGTTFKVAQMSTIMSQLKALSNEDSWGKRLQILKDIKGAEIANVESQTQTYGYGDVEETEPEKIGRTYTLRGICGFKAVSTGIKDMHSAYDVLFVHDGNVINGTKGSINGEAIMKGFTLSTLRVGAYSETIGTSSLPSYTVTVTLQSRDEWDRSYQVVPTDGDVMTELKSLINVTLDYYPASPVVVGTYSIGLSDCSGANFTSLYASEIVDTDNWVVTNADTGAALAITSIAVSGGRLTFTLTADAALTAATRIRISGAAISVLESNDIEGYELLSVEFPKA